MSNGLLENAFKLQIDTLNLASDFYEKTIKFSEMIKNPPQVKTGQTPSEVVYRKHRMKLLHYKPASDKPYKTPLLVVFAMVNKPYILDLVPGKSVIEFLVNKGFDVYMLDWGDPTTIDNNKGLDEYINNYFDRAVDWILKNTGVSKLSLFGYCMGGTMSLMYAALHKEKIKNLITMATPFDFTRQDGILFQWSKNFNFDELVETYGCCPGWYLNLSFAGLNPMSPFDKSLSFFKKLKDDKFVNLFLAMEKWASDSRSVPGKAFLEFMQGCYQKNLMIQNKFPIGDKTVDIKKLDCSFLNILGDNDNLVPPTSSENIGEYMSSKDKETLRCKTGHIGLSVSGKAYKNLWPRVAEWLAKRSDIEKKSKSNSKKKDQKS